MPKATDDNTTSPESAADRGRINAQQPETAASPLFDMEPVIGDMESFIRIIGHLVSSDNEVGPDEWLVSTPEQRCIGAPE
jgi:hypothetical protein